MWEILSGTFSGFGFMDLIDIAIVSFIIYKLIGVVRSSRLALLAKGLLVFIAVAVLSDVLHLYVINWIMTRLLNVGLVALVVVFQPELRRALEFLGRGTLGVSQFSLESEKALNTVDAIVHSVDYFAARREGAIIVIERQTALRDIAETGTRVDAEISEDLLENIFYKGSPLHDGAVILRGDRIFAAGCVLPLTQNPNLSRDLGTRHRAAIGITENSDAIAVVVSEETGIISMVEDGRLSRFLDLKTVEKSLLSIYLSAEEESDLKTRFLSLWRKKDNGEKTADN